MVLVDDNDTRDWSSPDVTIEDIAEEIWENALKRSRDVVARSFRERMCDVNYTSDHQVVKSSRCLYVYVSLLDNESGRITIGDRHNLDVKRRFHFYRCNPYIAIVVAADDLIKRMEDHSLPPSTQIRIQYNNYCR